MKCPREFSFVSACGHFQYLKEAYRKEGEGLFTQADRDKGNSFKLRGEIWARCKEEILDYRVVRHCHRMPRETVNDP